MVIYEYCKYYQKNKQLDVSSGLFVRNSQSINFFYDISHLKLQNLQMIILNKNNICSIENICRLHAPNLKSLALSNNNIISIRSLRKILSKQMKTLQLINNPFHHQQNVFQCFNFDSLSWIQLDWKSDNDVTLQSLNNLASLQSFPQKLYAISKRRIIANKVIISLEKKRQQSKIYFSERQQ